MEVIRLFVERGTALIIPDKSGNTPIFVAAQEGHLNVIRALAECGADMTSRDRDGTTPLMIATQNGHVKVM